MVSSGFEQSLALGFLDLGFCHLYLMCPLHLEVDFGQFWRSREAHRPSKVWVAVKEFKFE